MKGLIALFFAISVFGICWRYVDDGSKMTIKKVIRENLAPIVIAIVAVAVAIFLSMNTTLRFI